MGDSIPAGPLHLQRFLGPCTEIMASAMCNSVHHQLSTISALHCHCRVSTAFRPAGGSGTRLVVPPTGTTAGIALQPPLAGRGQSAEDADRRMACRFFALSLNEEDGVVHCTCRRCARLLLVYDRTLYWGMRRPRDTELKTFPYKCSCGGHAFEVAVGFEYLDEPLDENDIEMITVAVRCASCEEMAIVFDDEAT